jgi:O-succinylbenzoate synthase
MKIESIELRHVNMPLASPFSTSMGTDSSIEHIIVRIDAEGLIGWGECVAEATPFYAGETITSAWHMLQDFLMPAIIGKNPASVDQTVALYANVRGNNMAKAGLEAALWDVFAKARNVSLATMLGGKKKEIAVGVSIGIQQSAPELLEKIYAYRAEGYKRVKIKIAPGSDIVFVDAVRKEYPDLPLLVDANAAYELSHLNVFKRLDDYNLLLIEQPLGYDDLYDHSRLQRELTTPVGLDESICSLNYTRAALALESCRAINIKPGRVGGFTEAQRIHDYCALKNIPVWHGGMLESGIGRAGNIALASLPNFVLPADISASKRYYKHDIIEPEFTVDANGMTAVPTAAGIGVDVNTQMLEKVTVKKLYAACSQTPRNTKAGRS